MSESQNKLNDSETSRKFINDDSNLSIHENFVKTNKVFLDKGIDSAYKQLTTNLFNTINLAFTNFNNEYDKRVINTMIY